MSTVDSSPPTAPGAPKSGELPIFSRKSSGLVREVSFFNQLIFNVSSTSPLGAGIVFGLFALIIFPRSNIIVSGLIAIAVGAIAWLTIAVLSAAIPRYGGDYTINSRILHPVVGFAGNVCVFVGSALGAALAAVWVCTQALAPAFSVIGAVLPSSTMASWGTYLAGTHHFVTWLIAVAALALTSLLAVLGTRVIVRTMTVLVLLGVVGLVISMLILLFTSHGGFVNTINHQAGAGTYNKVVAAGTKAGLSSGQAGYSARSTFGGIFELMVVTFFVWWGTYLSAEFKGAGQRKRQIKSMVGAGFLQGFGVLICIAIFLHTVGRDFFASALAGNYAPGGGTVGTAGYAYFSALVANGAIPVVLISLLFLGWWLPLVNINLAMPQRAMFAWSMDGLLPERFGKVHEKWHTPVFAIGVNFVIASALAAWAAYGGPSFFKFLAVIEIFSYIPVVLFGFSAMLFSRLRPDIFAGSPADWRIGGVKVLSILGAGTVLASLLPIFLVYDFHTELGLVGWVLPASIISPIAVWGLATAWWYSVRAARKREGVDMTLALKAIPPD